jgi:hypothetical protein
MIPEVAGEERDPEPGARIRPYLRSPSPAAEPASATTPYAVNEVGEDAGEPAGPRPFVLTSGRVAGADPAIGLETQVTARPESGPWAESCRLAPELRAIVALCADPISVAEISARTRMHFGVTRVLVGDLRAAGHLDVQGSGAEAADPDIILRLIDGLRAIS